MDGKKLKFSKELRALLGVMGHVCVCFSAVRALKRGVAIALSRNDLSIQAFVARRPKKSHGREMRQESQRTFENLIVVTD
jgi:hypothetical protein